MRVVAAVRPNTSRTNDRVLALAEGFRASGHDVLILDRHAALPACGADLVIQAGFQLCPVLRDAMDESIPFVVCENPVWHYGDKYTVFGVGYNGLNGLSLQPETPTEGRPHPELLPMRDPSYGPVVVVGQVPTDRAMRGVDHDAWVRDALGRYPAAEFRRHPMTYDQSEQPPEALADCFARAGRIVTFTSTVGAEALIAGIPSEPDHPGSWAYGVTDRESWIHRLSWCQFGLEEADVAARHLLAGYDAARAQAEDGYPDDPGPMPARYL